MEAKITHMNCFLATANLDIMPKAGHQTRPYSPSIPNGAGDKTVLLGYITTQAQHNQPVIDKLYSNSSIGTQERDGTGRGVPFQLDLRMNSSPSSSPHDDGYGDTITTSEDGP